MMFFTSRTQCFLILKEHGETIYQPEEGFGEQDVMDPKETNELIKNSRLEANMLFV